MQIAILYRSCGKYCPVWNAGEFFPMPYRLFGQEDTEKIVVAPADGRIVVIEEVDENEYFHDRRLMISIFMSVINVHANWYPVDGTVKKEPIITESS